MKPNAWVHQDGLDLRDVTLGVFTPEVGQNLPHLRTSEELLLARSEKLHQRLASVYPLPSEGIVEKGLMEERQLLAVTNQDVLRAKDVGVTEQIASIEDGARNGEPLPLAHRLGQNPDYLGEASPFGSPLLTIAALPFPEGVEELAAGSERQGIGLIGDRLQQDEVQRCSQ